MNHRDLVNELFGRRCRCGRGKQGGFPFCFRCDKLLPASLRGDVFLRPNDHAAFDEAYRRAADYLDTHGGAAGSALFRAEPRSR